MDFENDRNRILIEVNKHNFPFHIFSDVLAAYASFLWEIEDDGEGDTSQPEYIQVSLPGHKFVNVLSYGSNVVLNLLKVREEAILTKLDSLATN
jgi:hypothetical protein